MTAGFPQHRKGEREAAHKSNSRFEISWDYTLVRDLFIREVFLRRPPLFKKKKKAWKPLICLQIMADGPNSPAHTPKTYQHLSLFFSFFFFM